MARRERLYVLYDGRAKVKGDEDDATILITENTWPAAEKASRDYKGMDAVWYEYQVADDGKTLIKGKMRWNLGRKYLA